jgi:hypothetical protein
MLNPGHADPRLNRTLVITRVLFLVLALLFVVVVLFYGLRDGMPGQVPSTARGGGGPRLATWEASPLDFVLRSFSALFTGLGVLLVVWLIVERLIIRRHGARPPVRRKYPH